MLTLNDGRSELYQWDTGRKLSVAVDCNQVHYSNKVFGRSIDVDVVDGVAIIPDILLQSDKELTAWAFVGTPENGYTKISKTFRVNRRNKPADYVFTPPEQTTLGELVERLQKIEETQDPDVIENAVKNYLDANPVRPGATTEQAAQIEQNKNDIADLQTEVDELKESGGNGSGQNVALTAAQIDLLENAFEHIQWADEDGPRYAAQLIASLRGGESGGEDEPETPAKTLQSISAVYTGGNVPVGTAVSSLSGVTVTAHYSDGSTSTVTGYTLSGTIIEGDNTVTVTYMGKTATITVTGEAQSAEGRVLLHNWDSSADNNSVDSVGGMKMLSHNGASITKDGYTLANGDDNFYFEEPLFAPNRSIEIDFGTVQHVPDNNLSVLFVWGTEKHPRGGKYWCGWDKPSGKWFWMEIGGDWKPEAYIDQLTDPNIISGKTVKFVINAAGNLSLYIDDAFISTAPFAVIDAPYFQLGKVNEGFSATTITAIRVYQEVAE